GIVSSLLTQIRQFPSNFSSEIQSPVAGGSSTSFAFIGSLKRAFAEGKFGRDAILEQAVRSTRFAAGMRCACPTTASFAFFFMAARTRALNCDEELSSASRPDSH